MRLIDADVLDYDIIKYFPRAFESTEDIVACMEKAKVSENSLSFFSLHYIMGS